MATTAAAAAKKAALDAAKAEAAGLDNLAAFDREDRKWRQIQLESDFHRKRIRIPTVDPANPFRAESQLRDEYELMELNKNPRLYIQSLNRATGLKRAYTNKGLGSSSPRGYVDHHPLAASVAFKKTTLRALPKELKPGAKPPRHSVTAPADLGSETLMGSTASAVTSVPSAMSATGSLTQGVGMVSSVRSAATTLKDPSTTSASLGKPPSQHSTHRTSRSHAKTLSKSSSAPTTKLQSSLAPSFGHRPQSASRHLDVLTMNASRPGPTYVDNGRLPLPPANKAVIKPGGGAGLLSAGDIARMLRGDAELARRAVSNAGMASLVEETNAALLFRTAIAAAETAPAAKEEEPTEGGSGSAREGFHHQEEVMVEQSVEFLQAQEAPQSLDAAVARAARARAHRGAKSPPKIGVGSGFAFVPDTRYPKFQVGGDKLREAGFLSDDYSKEAKFDQMRNVGVEIREQRTWMASHQRLTESMVTHSPSRDTPAGVESSISGSLPPASAGFRFTAKAVPRQHADGDMRPLTGYQDAESIFDGDEEGPIPGSIRFDASRAGTLEGDLALPAPESHRTEQSRLEAFDSAFETYAKASARRKETKKKVKAARAGRDLVWRETNWDASPHYMMPASKERFLSQRQRARDESETRADPDLERFVKLSAGTVQPLLCEERVATDIQLRHDELERLAHVPRTMARTYMKSDTAHAATPRDHDDEKHFTVDAALRHEKFVRERRASIARQNERRASVGLPAVVSADPLAAYDQPDAPTPSPTKHTKKSPKKHRSPSPNAKHGLTFSTGSRYTLGFSAAALAGGPPLDPSYFTQPQPAAPVNSVGSPLFSFQSMRDELELPIDDEEPMEPEDE